MKRKVIVVGSGNAALSAGISALENGAEALMLEKGDEGLAGGNTKYTAGSMRFTYNSNDDLLPLLSNPDDEKLAITDFGEYPREKFEEDLLKFNEGKPLSREQRYLIDESYSVVRWLASFGVKFEPIYSRQSSFIDEQYRFWGGLTLASDREGVGLYEQELAAYKKLGGKIRFSTPVVGLLTEKGAGEKVIGVICQNDRGKKEEIIADAVILGCGGFESSSELRMKYLGSRWKDVIIRGTPHNTGDGLTMAHGLGAARRGNFSGCHATPMDFHSPAYGGLHLEPTERKNFRKICYFLGVMLNREGRRFLDESKDFRNYTYAQFGRDILSQPGKVAYQFFDSKVFDHLYVEYHFSEAHYLEANNLDQLIEKITDIDKEVARQTLAEYNQAVDDDTPSILQSKMEKPQRSSLLNQTGLKVSTPLPTELIRWVVVSPLPLGDCMYPSTISVRFSDKMVSRSPVCMPVVRW